MMISAIWDMPATRPPDSSPAPISTGSTVESASVWVSSSRPATETVNEAAIR
jgi:hypothetical protein